MTKPKNIAAVALGKRRWAIADKTKEKERLTQISRKYREREFDEKLKRGEI